MNAGKGDASLIKAGADWIMIDTGPKEGFPEIGRQLVLNGVQRLSAVFITHGHADHIGGLQSVLSMVPCDALYSNADALNEVTDISQRARPGTRVSEMKTGDNISFGEARITAIGPVGSYKEENDRSLVFMLRYGDNKVLFAADQLFEAERDLTGLGQQIKADVLKVAHHGGADSTSAAFLAAVRPEYAVIPADSAGETAGQVTDALKFSGAIYYVLGDTGTMMLTSDGKSTEMKALRSEEETADIRIQEVDKSAEYVEVINLSSSDADLTGWCICTDKASDIFFFPSGTALKAGESLRIYSGKAASENKDGLFWTEEKIWGDGEQCTLFDRYGNQADKLKA